MAIWLLAVRRQKVRPTRAHVAPQMFDDERDGVRFRVERDEQVLIARLRDGPFAQTLVSAKDFERVVEVMSAEGVTHNRNLSKAVTSNEFKVKRSTFKVQS